MRRIVAIENVTLDGVMQAPGAPDEDTRGGFRHGGWSHAYADEVQMQVMGEGMAREGAMLFGRRTYEQFMQAWAGRDDNPFSPVLDGRRKYVCSTTLGDRLPWQNSSLLPGDAADAVARLKREDAEEELVLLGSGTLLRALLAAGLVDELTLLIHPLVLGTGTRLFASEGPKLELQAGEPVTTTTGVVIASYRPVAG